MCNLNILIKSEIGHLNKSIPSFLMGVTKNSYDSNSDGDGIFLSDRNILIKGKKKVNLYKYDNEILNSTFIITHQRIATSGMDVRYTQPFSNKEFVFVHNGIISELDDGKNSDTYNLFKNFNKIFNQVTGNRERRMVKAIKKIIETLNSWGSYSIAIFDKASKALYYFKNNGTFIHLYYKPNLLYITTHIGNDVFLNILENNFKEYKVNDYSIYKITKGNKIKIKECGRINKNLEKYETDGRFSSPFNMQDAYMGRHERYYETRHEQEDSLGESLSVYKDVIEADNGLCIECSKETNKIFITTGEHICNECLYWWEEHDKRLKLNRGPYDSSY